MSTSLTGVYPADSYKDLIKVSNANAGIDSSLRVVSDGEGTDSPLYLSNTKVKIQPSADSTDVFDIYDSSGNLLFQIDSTNKKVTAGTGVSFYGDGSTLSGITGATGGVSNTGSTNIVGDSDADGSGDITFSIGSTEIIRIANNGSGNGGSFKLVSFNSSKLATLTGDEIAYVNVNGVASVQDADGVHGVVLADKWSDPKGGYIFDGSDDKLPIENQTGIKSFALTVDLDSVSSVALGTFGTNLEIQIASGVVTLGSGFTNATVKVDTVTTTTITTGKHLIHVDFDDVSVSGGYWGYDGTNYGAFTLLRPELFNMQTLDDYTDAFYNNGSPETAVIPYELRGASQTATYTSDFSSGEDDWAAGARCTILGNVDSINSEDDWLEISSTDSGSVGNVSIYHNVSDMEYSKYQRVTLKLYSTSTTITEVKLYNSVGDVEIDSWTNYTASANNTITLEGLWSPKDLKPKLVLYGLANGEKAYIKVVKVYKTGNALDLKPENAGSNGWVGTLGGESVIANTSGSPIARGKGELELYRDGINSITGDTTLTDVIPAGYRIKSIFWKETAGGTATANIGTDPTTAPDDVVNGLSVTGGGEGLVTLASDFFSSSADQTLYISSADWSGAPSVDFIIVTEKAV